MSDWTRIKTRHWRVGPVDVMRIGSWAMYSRWSRPWRVGRVVCWRLGTFVVNVTVWPR